MASGRATSSRQRRYVRLVGGLIGLIALPMATGQTALAGPPGPPGPPRPTCEVRPGSFGADLGANVNLGFHKLFSPAAGGVSAADQLIGFPSWDFILANASTTAVSNPRITASSGYPPSQFGGSLPTPTLPTSCTVPGLSPGQQLFFPPMQAQGVAATFNLGFDASKSVSPAVIPVGGGRQTVTVTATLRDPRYGAGNNLGVTIAFGPGDSIISTTAPSNLDQGERLNPSPGQPNWFLNQAVLGKQYTFSAVINYANPFAGPWTHLPEIAVSAASFSGDCAPCDAGGSSVTIPVPSLDGGLPGSGAVTLAVDQTDHRWRAGVGSVYAAHFQGTLPDVNGREGPDENATQPASVDATSGVATLSGSRSWDFQIKAGQPLANPTVRATSGYPAGIFSTFTPPGVTATTDPIMFTAPGPQGFEVGLNAPSLGVDFTAGYDSTRSVEPLVVPVGGGRQTVIATVTAVDTRVHEFNILFFDSLGGVTTVSMTDPANLDQGERLGRGGPGFASWSLGNAVTGKTYAFTATIAVPNPFGVPFAHKSSIHLFGHVPLPGGCVGCLAPSSSATVSEPTLDGGTAGSGTVTFSVGDGGHIWNLVRDERRIVRYQPTRGSGLFGLGPATVASAGEVHAVLYGAGRPLGGAAVLFAAGGSSCTAITAPDGRAACTLSPSLPSGQYTLSASFAGNESFYPSSAAAPLIVYEATQFVIWGGNPGGVVSGADYTFWGSSWADQVTSADSAALASFKGYANSVAGGVWSASPGASSRPPDSVGTYIGVLIATSAVKHGRTISGSIGGMAVLRVDDPAAYAPNPGHAGTGVLVALTG